MKIRVNHQPSGGKEWVAKITGKHPQYKFEREFLTADDREWSRTGKTGWTYYEVEEGEIYEVNEPWHGRYFVTIENGETREIHAEDVLRMIESKEERKEEAKEEETKEESTEEKEEEKMEMEDEEGKKEEEKNEEEKEMLRGEKKLEDGTVYEVLFNQEYGYKVLINGEEIDRFGDKKIFWYKALAKAPGATTLPKPSEDEARKWMLKSGYQVQ